MRRRLAFACMGIIAFCAIYFFDKEETDEMHRIKNGLLTDTQVIHTASPDHGGAISPEVIVIHYTGSGSMKGSVGWLSKVDEIYVSAHIVISREGRITQLVPFDKQAFHVGHSELNGVKNVNKFSIGIELVNWGKLQEGPNKLLKSYVDTEVHRDGAILEQHPKENQKEWWQRFTTAQEDTLIPLVGDLIIEYGMAANCIVGHSDVSDHKLDPGPAFDMEEFKKNVIKYIGQQQPTEDEDREEQFVLDEEGQRQRISNLISNMQSAAGELYIFANEKCTELDDDLDKLTKEFKKLWKT